MLQHYWAVYRGGVPLHQRNPAGHLVPMVFYRRRDARCHQGTVVKVLVVPLALIEKPKKRKRTCRKT